MPAVLVEFESAKAAKGDLSAVARAGDLDLVERALGDLASDPQPKNLDIKMIRRPWLRLRVGNWRILYRPMTVGEVKRYGKIRGQPKAKMGFLVARVVNRRDLRATVLKLS